MNQILLKRIGTIAALVFSTLLASRGAIEALFQKKLMTGHDTSAYALLMSEFHDNILHGNWIPVWASHLQHGYGEAHLLFRPPLQSYLTEVFIWTSKSLFTAINMTPILYFALAGIGMFLLAKHLSSCLKDSHFSTVQALFAAIAYQLSPYFLQDIYVRGALSEAASFLILPWTTLFFIRLADEPNLKTFSLASIGYSLLLMSHPAIAIFVTAYTVLCAVIYRNRIKNWKLLCSSFVLGAAASSFYWGISMVEWSNTKSAILGVDFESYVGHFIRLDQLLYMQWNHNMPAVRFSLGIVICFGLFVGSWILSRDNNSKSIPAENKKLILVLVSLTLVCIYFMHRTSAFWYETLPIIQGMTFPWRNLLLTSFFGVLLASRAASFIFSKIEHWVIAVILIILFSFSDTRPFGFQTIEESTYSGENIARSGFYFPKNSIAPTSLGIAPKFFQNQLVEVLKGRAELNCARNGPTVLDCEVLAIQNSVLRANILDFPGWNVYLDQKKTEDLKRDPIFGMLSTPITPGKHKLIWRFEDTTSRLIFKIISALSWLFIFTLLFKNQIAKAKSLFPKSSQNLASRATPKVTL